jgi:hypothetical protein
MLIASKDAMISPIYLTLYLNYHADRVTLPDAEARESALKADAPLTQNPLFNSPTQTLNPNVHQQNISFKIFLCCFLTLENSAMQQYFCQMFGTVLSDRWSS